MNKCQCREKLPDEDIIEYYEKVLAPFHLKVIQNLREYIKKMKPEGK